MTHNTVTTRLNSSSPSQANLMPTGPVSVHNQQGQLCINESCKNDKNPLVRSAYNMVSAASAFFVRRFGLQGIGVDGMNIVIGWNENNAAWACSWDMRCRMLLNNSLINQDIITHEYTHSLIQKFRPLDPMNQPGALNESLSDIFAIIFKQEREGSHFWKIVDRDLSIPINMSQYDIDLANIDNGGVHANSRIPSHAFYLAVEISQTPSNGVMADVWFNSMVDQTRPSGESFSAFALRTISWGEKLTSQMNKIHSMRLIASIGQAWVQVGILKYEVYSPLNLDMPLVLPPFTKQLLKNRFEFKIASHGDGTYSIVAFHEEFTQIPNLSLMQKSNPQWGWVDKGRIDKIVLLESKLNKEIHLNPNTLLGVQLYFTEIMHGRVVDFQNSQLLIEIGRE